MGGFRISKAVEMTAEEQYKLRRARWQELGDKVAEDAMMAEQSVARYLDMEAAIKGFGEDPADCSDRIARGLLKMEARYAYAELSELALTLRTVMNRAMEGLVPGVDIAGTGLSESELHMVCEMAGHPAATPGAASKL